TNAPCLISNNPAASNPTPLGTCITQVKGLPYTNPFGELGTRAAFSPPWQFNIRGRYDWVFQGYNAFVSVGASHVGPMSNEPASFPSGDDPAQNPPTTTLLRYQIPSYTTYDASVGASKDNWSVLFSGSNLGDSDASTNISSGQFIRSQIPLRP